MFDFLLLGGELIDGTGAPRRRADLAVKDGALRRLPKAEAPETTGPWPTRNQPQRIEIPGRVVCPGFVDVHNHRDGWMLRQPTLDPKVVQGFTTEVLAADGISYAPVSPHTARDWVFYLQGLNALRFDEYRGWQTLEEMMLSIDGAHVQNAATHIPYANLRAMACGWGRRAVDDVEMARDSASDSHRHGNGRRRRIHGTRLYQPVFRNHRGIDRSLLGHGALRRPLCNAHPVQEGIARGVGEAFEIGRRAEVPVHISHLKAFSEEIIESVLGAIDQASRDVDISFESTRISPARPCSTTCSRTSLGGRPIGLGQPAE